MSSLMSLCHVHGTVAADNTAAVSRNDTVAADNTAAVSRNDKVATDNTAAVCRCDAAVCRCVMQWYGCYGQHSCCRSTTS